MVSFGCDDGLPLRNYFDRRVQIEKPAERLLLKCERLNAPCAQPGGKAAPQQELQALWLKTYEFCGHAASFTGGL